MEKKGGMVVCKYQNEKLVGSRHLPGKKAEQVITGPSNWWHGPEHPPPAVPGSCQLIF